MSADRDDFECWIMQMDDEIDILIQTLPKELALKMDYSIDALSAIEIWLLDNFNSVAALMHQENKALLDRLGRYVGETIRKNTGGVWDIELEDEKCAFYRIPILRSDDNSEKWEECPLSLVTASIDRRKGNYIKKVVNALVKRLCKFRGHHT